MINIWDLTLEMGMVLRLRKLISQYNNVDIIILFLSHYKIHTNFSTYFLCWNDSIAPRWGYIWHLQVIFSEILAIKMADTTHYSLIYCNVLLKYLLIVKKTLLKYEIGVEAARADGVVSVYHKIQCFKIPLMNFLNDKTSPILKSGIGEKVREKFTFLLCWTFYLSFSYSIHFLWRDFWYLGEVDREEHILTCFGMQNLVKILK